MCGAGNPLVRAVAVFGIAIHLKRRARSNGWLELSDEKGAEISRGAGDIQGGNVV